jgi:hypothetical protein
MDRLDIYQRVQAIKEALFRRKLGPCAVHRAPADPLHSNCCFDWARLPNT